MPTDDEVELPDDPEELLNSLAAQYEEASGEVPDPDEEAPDEETPDADDEFEIDGEKYSKDKIKQLHTLEQYLNDNPAVAQTLTNSFEAVRDLNVQRSAAIPPTNTNLSEPETPPEGVEDDPALKLIWERMQLQQQQLDNQRSELQRREAVEATSEVERACTDWSSRYKLDDETIKIVRAKAAELGVLPALRAKGKSFFDATTAALDSAFWSMPDIRNKYLTAQFTTSSAEDKKQKAKQQKLGALAGRSSAPTGSKPVSQMTPAERKEAMIADIAHAMEA